MILGAAVIHDVQGLLVLVIVSDMATAAAAGGAIPLGAVGYIFVATGVQLKTLTQDIQAAVVAAMLFTTMIGPIGLSRLLRRPRT